MARTIDLRKKKNKPEESPQSPKQTSGGDTAAGAPVFVPEKEIVLPQRSRPTMRPSVIQWVGLAYPLPFPTRVPYIVAVLFWIAGGLLVYLKQDIITAALFGLLGIMLIVVVRKAVPVVEIEVTSKAIRVGEIIHGIANLKSFWIIYEPELDIKELHLQFKRWYQPYLKIPLGDQNPVQIRSILLESIPEEVHEETIIDALSRRLGL